MPICQLKIYESISVHCEIFLYCSKLLTKPVEFKKKYSFFLYERSISHHWNVKTEWMEIEMLRILYVRSVRVLARKCHCQTERHACADKFAFHSCIRYNIHLFDLRFCLVHCSQFSFKWCNFARVENVTSDVNWCNNWLNGHCKNKIVNWIGKKVQRRSHQCGFYVNLPWIQRRKQLTANRHRHRTTSSTYAM